MDNAPSNQVVDLVIRNGYVITMDSQGTRHQMGDIAVQDGAISAIGPLLQSRGRHEVDAKGNAILPGLINCHMHETLIRGLCEDLPLMRWLEEICYRKDRAMRPEHSRAAAYMNQLEMIRGGTTTFIDIWRFPGEAAAVAEQSGLRAIFSPQVFDQPAGSGETLESNLHFIREWKDRVPGRIFTWFGPHAPYSCTIATFKAMRDLAEQLDVGIHTHLAVTQDEVDLIRKQHGMTPVEFMNSLGMLSPRFLAAHAIYLTEGDIRLLAEHGVATSYNPSSNMKLADGVAKVLELLAAGVRVGLGTDSNLSNNNLDMFEEMRIAATLQKLWRKDAEAFPCELSLRMSTSLAAECLGLESLVGSLEIGKRADIIIVNLHAPHMWPILAEPHSNVVEQLVYSAGASDVLTTIVDGKILMEERTVRTLDTAPLEQMVNAAAVDLLRRSGLEERLRLIDRQGWKRLIGERGRQESSCPNAPDKSVRRQQ